MNRFEHFSLDIFRISHCWNAIASEEMKVYGLKGISALYLILLYHATEDMTAAKLVKMCSRDKAEISRSLVQFREKGFLNPNDGENYRKVLTLTERGKEAARHLEKRVTRIIESASKGISDQDRNTMYEALDIIAGNLQQVSYEGLPET